jgi:hypothetical protein
MFTEHLRMVSKVMKQCMFWSGKGVGVTGHMTPSIKHAIWKMAADGVTHLQHRRVVSQQGLLVLRVHKKRVVHPRVPCKGNAHHTNETALLVTALLVMKLEAAIQYLHCLSCALRRTDVVCSRRDD